MAADRMVNPRHNGATPAAQLATFRVLPAADLRQFLGIIGRIVVKPPAEGIDIGNIDSEHYR